MTWRIEDPQGNEAAKIRFEALPYLQGGFDLGCGARPVWPHMIGIDNRLDEKLFGVQTNPNLVADCANLAMFADGCAASIFSSHLLEHIVDHKAALREWWRLVRVGGFLVLYLPHADFYPNIGKPGANPDHKHDFRPADIVDAMVTVADDWDMLEAQSRNGGNEYSMFLVFRKGKPGTGRHFSCHAPKHPKRAGIVRFGGNGDAIWSSSPAAHLKAEGYHVTVFATIHGATLLAHDPNVDRLVVVPENACTPDDLIAFYAHQGAKFDRWVNLIGSVETRLLAHGNELGFYWRHDLRDELMSQPYMEAVHHFAGLPKEAANLQRFYPNEIEKAWARGARELLKGPLVVIAPSGSSPAKYWPHAQKLIELLAARGVYSVVLGAGIRDDVVGVEPFGSVVGMDWPLRNALSFALLADAVVGTESAIVNGVANEDMLKVVTMSHSWGRQLLTGWRQAVAVEPKGLACYPCHRIHASLAFCARDAGTNAAACQSMADPQSIAELVLEYLGQAGKLHSEAAE